jgi:hypothetical protein
MRRKQLLFSMILLAVVFSVALNGCKKDKGASDLSLVSVKVGTIDLNGAVSPSNVPANPVITATFNTNVDQTTATNANITLTRDYDQANIPLTISVAGAIVTITPTAGAIGSGALFKLTVTTAVKGTGNLLLTAELSRTFTTVGTFVPTGQTAHWSFENNAVDSVGGLNPNAAIGITYVASRKASAGMAASFNGTTSIIEIPNADVLESLDFTLALWVKIDSNAHPQQHFILGLGAFYGFQFQFDGGDIKMGASYKTSTDTVGQDLIFNGNGKTKENGGFMGFTYCKDLTASGGVGSYFYNSWAHVVCTYEVATKVGSMYIDGKLMFQQDFNLYIGQTLTTAEGMAYHGKLPDVKNDLAFGFIKSRAGSLWSDQSWGGYSFPGANHFKGLLDDVRIFNRALTSAEVGLMYNSEKP